MTQMSRYDNVSLNGSLTWNKLKKRVNSFPVGILFNFKEYTKHKTIHQLYYSKDRLLKIFVTCVADAKRQRAHWHVNSGNATTGKVCFYVSLCFLGGTGSLTHWNNERYINTGEILLIILDIINITVHTIMCGLWRVKVLMILTCCIVYY